MDYLWIETITHSFNVNLISVSIIDAAVIQLDSLLSCVSDPRVLEHIDNSQTFKLVF